MNTPTRHFLNLGRGDLARYLRRYSAHEKISFRKRLAVTVYSCGFHATLIYRLGKWLEKGSSFSFLIKFPLIIIQIVLQFLVRVLYDIWIDRSADIGRSVYIGHFGGIRLYNCVVGENCSVHQQTRIGRPNRRGATYPKVVIGNNVWIGPHTEIHPGSRVEDGAAVAAGSQVIGRIPRNALAGGRPARVIFRSYDSTPLL